MSVFRSARIVFHSLRIAGTFPYSFKKLEGTTEAEGIRFRTFSCLSGWTLSVILARILLGYNALVSNTEDLEDTTGGGTDVELSARLKNSYEGLVTKTLLNSICIHSIYQSVVPILSIRQECKLSGLWEEFHILFKKTVGTVRVCRLKKATFFACAQLALISLPVFIISFGNVKGRKIKEGQTQIDFILRQIELVLRSVVTMLFPQFEDLKFFINCYFIQMYFGEIQNVIRDEVQAVCICNAECLDSVGVFSFSEDVKSGALRKSISSRKVEKWHSLLAAIHEITSATGRVMGMPQILSTLHELFIVTLTAYSSTILFQEVSQGSIVYYGVGAACFYLFRTFQRCYISQMISNQEHEILRTVESIQCDQLDVLAKQEVRFLLECLLNRPCSMSLSGYIKANNKLFLQILGTILTYVIVLVQFKDVYRQ